MFDVIAVIAAAETAAPYIRWINTHKCTQQEKEFKYASYLIIYHRMPSNNMHGIENILMLAEFHLPKYSNKQQMNFRPIVRSAVASLHSIDEIYKAINWIKKRERQCNADKNNALKMEISLIKLNKLTKMEPNSLLLLLGFFWCLVSLFSFFTTE